MPLMRLMVASDLEFMGLWLPCSKAPCPTDHLLFVEEARATMAGRLALSMVAARASRGVALLRGWPHRAVRLLDEQLAAETIGALRSDQERFLALRRLGAQGHSKAAMLAKRSCMSLPFVQQLCLALCKSPGDAWALTEDTKRWMIMKQRRLVGSLICEDGFNIQKNHQVIKSKRRYMKPQKSSALLITEQVSVCARIPHDRGLNMKRASL